MSADIPKINNVCAKTPQSRRSFNFRDREIAFSFSKGETLGKHIYGDKYNDLPFKKMFRGLPFLTNLVEVLGGGGCLILLKNGEEEREYIIGVNGNILKRWREDKIGRVVLARVGDKIYIDIFAEVKPILRSLSRKYPKDELLKLMLRNLRKLGYSLRN